MNVHPHSSWQAAGAAIVIVCFVPAAIYTAVRCVGPELVWPALRRACRTIGKEKR